MQKLQQYLTLMVWRFQHLFINQSVCIFRQAETQQHLRGMLKAFLATEDHQESISTQTQPRLIPNYRRKTSWDSNAET